MELTTTFNDKQIRILQVAERLFADKGFDGTSIRSIAKDAKINIAMVSYYFGSKEKMLEALIYSRTADMKLQLENLLREAISPVEKIDRLIELYLARVQKNKGIYQILHFEFSSRKRGLNFKTFTEVKMRNLEYVRQIICEGQQQGIFRSDINVALIPPTILGTFFHVHMNRPFYEDLLGLKSEDEFNRYVDNELTKHIQKTIKALITNEIN